MTSGNIRMGPDPDGIKRALERALDDDPSLGDLSAEELSKALAGEGHLGQEPDPVLVAEILGAMDRDEPGEETGEASPT